MAENEVSVVDSGTYYTPESQKMKRRLAEAMLKQGLDASPIASPWQGLARIAQAMLGGYNAYKLDADEKRNSDEIAAYRSGRATAPTQLGPSLSGASGAAAPPSSPIAATDPADPLSPASVRNNNPGAQYPGATATRFGSTGFQTIGGGHKIATFPDAESGAAAQFDLLKSGYAGMPLRDAMAKWGGGNNTDAYTALVAARTGLKPDAVITPELLASPQGIALAKAMARHEAGVESPLSDQQWSAAQARAFGSGTPKVAQAPSAPGVTTDALPSVPGISVMPPDASLGGLQAPPIAQASQPVASPPGALGRPQGTPVTNPQPMVQLPTLGQVASPPITQQQLEAEAYKNLGARGELVRVSRSSRNPDVQKAAEAEFQQALARVQQTQMPTVPMDQAKLAESLSKTRENEAQLPKHTADARKAEEEARKLKMETDAVASGAPSPTKYSEEFGKTKADIEKDIQVKGEGAIEFLNQLGETREMIANRGRVIGRYASPGEHGGHGSTRVGVDGSPVDIPIPAGFASSPIATTLKTFRDIVGNIPHVEGTIPGTNVQVGVHNDIADDNMHRDLLEQKFTKLAQSGLKATYGSRVTNIDVAQQQKTVPQLTDAGAETSLEKLKTLEAQSWRALQDAIRLGRITPDQLRQIPPDMLVQALRDGKLKIGGE